jgi:hypothetical protein
VKQEKLRDNTKEASAMVQTCYDRLRLTKKVDAVASPVDLPSVTLAINTFTEEVWTYHCNRCPLYKDLFEWLEELKGEALMNKRFNFSPVYLRHMLWKMMIEVNRFNNQESML